MLGNFLKSKVSRNLHRQLLLVFLFWAASCSSKEASRAQGAEQYESIVEICSLADDAFALGSERFRLNELGTAFKHLTESSFNLSQQGDSSTLTLSQFDDCRAMNALLLSRVQVLTKEWQQAVLSLKKVYEIRPDWQEERLLLQILADAHDSVSRQSQSVRASLLLAEAPLYSTSGRAVFERMLKFHLESIDSCKASKKSAQQESEAVPRFAVVLGHALSEGNRLSARAIARLDKLKAILQSNPDMEVVFSGKGDGPQSEAETMLESLTQEGRRPKNFRLESESRDTIQNALYSLRLVSDAAATRGELQGKIALVTDEDHMSRASVVFNEALLQLSSSTSQVQANRNGQLASFQVIPACALLPKDALPSVQQAFVDDWLATARDVARLNGVWLKPGVFQ